MPYPNTTFPMGFNYNYPNQFENYNWNQQNTQPQQQPINGYIQVAGYEGVQAYNMPPNSRAPLFDTNNDVFYDVQTDANGKKTIRMCPFTVQEDDPSNSTVYATKEDIKEIQTGMKDLDSKFDSIMEALNGK